MVNVEMLMRTQSKVKLSVVIILMLITVALTIALNMWEHKIPLVPGDVVVFKNHGIVTTGVVERSRIVMIPGDGPTLCYSIRFDDCDKQPELTNALGKTVWIPPKFLKRCPQ